LQAPTLKKRVLKASVWSLGGHFASQILRLVSNLVLTRMLAPEMFGVISVVMLIVVGIALLTDIGLSSNVIQSKHTDDPDFMNTIWSIQLIKGFFIWGMLCLVAVALYFLVSLNVFPANVSYANPALPFYLMAIGFTSVINGLEPTWILLAAKNLKPKLITIIDFVSQTSSFITTLIVAYFFPSVWALVIGTIGGALMRLVLALIFNDAPMNKWHIEKKYFYEIVHFGKWIVVSTIFGYMVTNGDRLLLGGMVSEELMGLHSIAYLFILTLMGIHSKFVNSIVFPALSEVKNEDGDRLKNIYYKFRLMSDFFLMTMAGFLWCSSSAIINFLYDDRYLAVGEILKIMSLSIVAMRYNLADSLFLSLNKPKYLTINILVKLITLLILFPLVLNKYGFYAALYAVVIANFMSNPISIYFTKKVKLLDVKYEILMLPMFFIGILLGYIVNYFLSYFKHF
jgi:O-antigen/teichoic acid export membrane protein